MYWKGNSRLKIGVSKGKKKFVAKKERFLRHEGVFF